MPYFYKCRGKKILAGIPSVLATALILYISIIFVGYFLPDRFQKEGYTLFRLCIEIPFLYFSFMTLLSLFLTAASDPGYLADQYQHPLTPEGHAPLAQLRVHNMKLFTANKLYDFSKVNEDLENSALLNQSTQFSSHSNDEVEMRQIYRQITE
jgi:hypothetical protein